ncbi:hypothetical protein PsorP6_013187 [Peronosclerospora sorghi]|uniref:Uncharacterized protein n=1 Tax=Peronosclerospora sorghi TaxID=230839 RepID=A0ACC0WIW9_9STRA|nr:hypothetical protein PsorP6_013187 [Peronosclerospora sorghi]
MYLSLAIVPKPTGYADCPESVRRAKRARWNIGVKPAASDDIPPTDEVGANEEGNQIRNLIALLEGMREMRRMIG